MNLLDYIYQDITRHQVEQYAPPARIVMRHDTAVDCLGDWEADIHIDLGPVEFFGFPVKFDPAMPRGRWRLEP